MKHLTLALLTALTLAACSHDVKPKIAYQPTPPTDDTMIYGLVCDGSNDTIIVFLHDPYDGSNPDTLDILDASRNGQVFGTAKIGKKVALLRDTASAEKASVVIITEDLLGQWCYRVKPELRRTADMDGQSAEGIITHLPDSIRQLLDEEVEYGFQLKIDSMAMPVGMRNRARQTADESPVVYPRMKRYTRWHISDGLLLLTEARMDSLGNSIPLSTDTAALVALTPDTLVLRFAEGEKGFYRKTDSGE